jgi:hypothetical protein
VPVRFSVPVMTKQDARTISRMMERCHMDAIKVVPVESGFLVRAEANGLQLLAFRFEQQEYAKRREYRLKKQSER